jgi:hypothetical protein
MANRIRSVEVRNLVLNPAEAELSVRLHPEGDHEGAEVRGRFSGPVCAYSSTVEVAYPLQSLAGRPDDLGNLQKRVVIPEPSWWEPVSPFLYNASIELWEHGQLCDRVETRHGLRALRRSGRGFLLNGRPLQIRGACYDHQSREELMQLHQAGVNTLVVPVTGTHEEIWDMADQLGFLVIGRLGQSEKSVSLARSLGDHACVFGWVLEPDAFDEPDFPALGLSDEQGLGRFVGVQWRGAAARYPEGAQFVLCKEEDVSSATQLPLPILALIKRPMIQA